MAASFAAPGASGRAVGLVMSGLLIGILAARSVAGLLSELGAGMPSTGWAPWPRPAWALLLRRALPLAQPAQPIGYGAVMRSLLTLAREQPRPAQPRADRRHGLCHGERAVLDHGTAAGRAGLRVWRCADRPHRPGRRGRRPHGQHGRAAGRPGAGASAPRWPAACSWLAGWGALWLGGTSLSVVPGGTAHRRCRAAGPAHQQPERDLCAGTLGALAHQCGLYDGLFHRRLGRLGSGLGVSGCTGDGQAPAWQA